MNSEQKVQSIISALKAMDDANSDRLMKWLRNEMNKLTQYEVQLLERKLADLGIAIGG